MASLVPSLAYVSQWATSNLLFPDSEFFAGRAVAEVASTETVYNQALSFIYSGRWQYAYYAIKKFLGEFRFSPAFARAESDPYYSALRYVFGVTCVQLNENEEAQKAFLKKYNVDSHEKLTSDVNLDAYHAPVSYYWLGVICRRTQRREAAIDYLTRAWSAVPYLWSAFQQLCELGAPVKPNDVYQEYSLAFKCLFDPSARTSVSLPTAFVLAPHVSQHSGSGVGPAADSPSSANLSNLSNLSKEFLQGPMNESSFQLSKPLQFQTPLGGLGGDGFRRGRPDDRLSSSMESTILHASTPSFLENSGMHSMMHHLHGGVGGGSTTNNGRGGVGGSGGGNDDSTAQDRVDDECECGPDDDRRSRHRASDRVHGTAVLDPSQDVLSTTSTPSAASTSLGTNDADSSDSASWQSTSDMVLDETVMSGGSSASSADPSAGRRPSSMGQWTPSPVQSHQRTNPYSDDMSPLQDSTSIDVNIISSPTDRSVHNSATPTEFLLRSSAFTPTPSSSVTDPRVQLNSGSGSETVPFSTASSNSASAATSAATTTTATATTATATHLAGLSSTTSTFAASSTQPAFSSFADVTPTTSAGANPGAGLVGAGPANSTTNYITPSPQGADEPGHAGHVGAGQPPPRIRGPIRSRVNHLGAGGDASVHAGSMSAMGPGNVSGNPLGIRSTRLSYSGASEVGTLDQTGGGPSFFNSTTGPATGALRRPNFSDWSNTSMNAGVAASGVGHSGLRGGIGINFGSSASKQSLSSVGLRSHSAGSGSGSHSPVSWAIPSVDYPALLRLLLQYSQSYAFLSSHIPDQTVKRLSMLPEAQKSSALVQFWLAKSHVEMSDYQNAAIHFENMRKQEPYRVEGLEIYSSVLWHLQQESALSALILSMASVNRLAPEFLCSIGNYFSLLKNHAKALKYFQRAIQVDRRFTYAYTLCGHELVASNDTEAAMRYYRDALSLDSRHYNAWYGIGMIYFRQEKFSPSLSYFRKALEINQSSSVLHCFYGMALMQLSQNQEALGALDKAVSLFNGNYLAHFKRACVRVSLKQFDIALSELIKLTNAAPREALVHVMIGKIYKAQGNHELSRIHYQKASDLDPRGTAAYISGHDDDLTMDDIQNNAANEEEIEQYNLESSSSEEDMFARSTVM